MKYENGKDIFPERLLKQIQKYVSGKLVYIPSRSEKKTDWGEVFEVYAVKRLTITIFYEILPFELKTREGVASACA